jgi:hypothetical protein
MELRETVPRVVRSFGSSTKWVSVVVMRRSLSGLFRLGFPVFSSSIVVLAVACGGGGDAKEGAKSPSGSSSGDGNGTTSASGGDNSGAQSGSSGAGPASGSSSGSTTTTQLGDGGDLQGAKLGSKVHSETESKGESGPKSTHGLSAGEPGRTAKDIQTIVVVRRDEARACYDKGLAAHPGIEGDLDVRWKIDPQGNVADASVDTTKSTILEPSVGACIIDVIKKIKFAASPTGRETNAHYPFNFHPKTFSAKDAGK